MIIKAFQVEVSPPFSLTQGQVELLFNDIIVAHSGVIPAIVALLGSQNCYKEDLQLAAWIFLTLAKDDEGKAR